ncbi:tetratricopeptide repeat protein [Geomicrobium sp. JSM 1781026]|uniref:tetratricopeptide repeat protein n=1 Tax=Geomicrobium sp. JSM 1781026 TaxID=3344580 RepID=UPI0035BEECAD
MNQDTIHFISLISDWYQAIIQKDIQKAQRLHLLIKQMKEYTATDRDVYRYYKLADLRYSLGLEIKNRKLAEKKISDMENCMTRNRQLNTLFTYLTGQYEFRNGSFEQALRHYQEAEDSIQLLSNPYEVADFYHRLGECYYRTNQNNEAIDYLKRAISIFEKNRIYELRQLDSQSLLASVYTDNYDFNTAEQLFNRTLNRTSEYSFIHPIALCNYALNRIKVQHFDKALETFEKSLTYSEHHDSYIGTKNKYQLALLYIRNSKIDQALKYARLVKFEAQLNNYDNYYIRYCFISALIKQDKNRAIEIINKLKSLSDSDAEEMINEVLEVIGDQNTTIARTMQQITSDIKLNVYQRSVFST